MRRNKGLMTRNPMPISAGLLVNTERHFRALKAFAMSDAVSNRTIGTLAERGVLVETTGMRRNRVCQRSGVLAILHDDAEFLRRPAA